MRFSTNRLFVFILRTRHIIVLGLVFTLIFTALEYFRLDVISPYKTQSKDASLEHLLELVWPRKACPTDYGFQGKGVVLNVSNLSEKERTLHQLGYQTHKVNQLVSDKIPLRREIPLNIAECKKFVNSIDTEDLPSASVVMPMHNEMWSTLMRSIFSILDAGPDHLIKEIMIVDDASTNADLGAPLEHQIGIFGRKVKVLRLPERSGLIRARLRGIEQTTGDVIVILDAHVEVHRGWLEPLLHRIKQNNQVIAIPDINVINYDTYEVIFSNSTSVAIGGFTLDMVHHWQARRSIVGRDRQTLTDPVPTPTHLGCCLAVSRKNFQRLGLYDPGLNIWGCENQELSFKTWMCGGRLEIIPCSHVAHMFRKSFPYTWGQNSGLTHVKNCMRVAEVWMDEYKQLYYDRIGLTPDKVDIGDISAQRSLRKNLQCQSFHWYVQTVYPSLFASFKATKSDLKPGEYISLLAYHMESHTTGINNRPFSRVIAKTTDRSGIFTINDIHEVYFDLTREEQIRQDEECLNYNPCRSKQITTLWCDGMESPTIWIYTEDHRIESSNTECIKGKRKFCITLSPNRKAVYMTPCSKHDPLQKWIWYK